MRRWGCYYDLGVRESYPSLSVNGRRGSLAYLGHVVPPQAPEATDTPPGVERIPIYEERAAAGFAIFHPLDSVIED